jgi:F-type H+-transporting ATPase subunit delta
MADNLTLARPYAKAIFEIASANQTYLRWSYVLSILTALVSDQLIKPLLRNQSASTQELSDFFCEIVSSDFTEEECNLIRVLVDSRRMGIVEQVALLYEQLKADAEKTLKVDLLTAIPLNENQREQFSKSLGHYFSRTIELNCELDSNLIGGYVAKAGNQVIDGSLKSELKKLQQSMGGG